LLRLLTLGGLSLHSEAVELTGAARQRRRLALLAALAVSGDRGVTRDRILGLLWTDVDETRGRQALSQSLYALRRDTGRDDLVVGADALRLNPDAITSDIGDFGAAIAGERLEDAAGLYTGPFLDGVYVADAGEFERWAELERARHARIAERAIEMLAARAESRGDHLDAATWWRKLVSIDPLKTRANLGLVSALVSAGERVNAMRHLDAYTELVRTELNAEPGADARVLRDRLRHEPHDGTVGGRYTIERELGRGGMARVFLAHDARHDRPVAIKMLHPEYAAAIGRDRIELEILVTARMQHPHILPLHDSGEHGGTRYYVMPFVDGESLRDRLTRESQLSMSDAIRYTREIADALDHAHRHGVIHRDIKPENVLLADGHAVVADFGIARVVSTSIDDPRTQSGMALGTPAYMSPEQMAGEEDIGPASDLFSLGCVLFEMLTGRPPWIAASTQALLTLRLTTPAPRLRSVRRDAPTWLDGLLRRLLATDAGARVASAATLVGMLQDSSFRASSHLPAPPDALIGRAGETVAATALLTSGEVRLLTFTGAGGTGKTRLALETAAACEPHFDAVSFVDVSSVTLPREVESAMAEVLGVHTAEGVDQFAAIAAAIGATRMLLVLDNFEQVVSAAPMIARLLGACRNLKVLVTSRVRLGVRGEHEFFVAPLALRLENAQSGELAPAVALFVSRARSAQASFTADPATLATIDAICARLDGLPLAIELAAARCRLMSPAAMLARLESGFDVLTGGARDMPARHQTMRRAIQWSHGLLDAVHQDLLSRLAVFSGGFSLAAAERVCSGGEGSVGVLDGVATLLDASLLMREPATDQDGEPRMRMLETVREFAHEQLLAAPHDLASRIANRHRDWALSVATTLGPQLTGATQRTALTALGLDRTNLLSAFDRTVKAGDATLALAFVAATWRFWLVRRGLAEGREIIERALALAAPPEADALRAEAMVGAGHLLQNAGDIAGASRYFADVLAIRRRLGDRRGETRSLADLGWLSWRRCNYPEARALSLQCRDLARAAGDEALEALALGNLGFIDHCEGNLDAATGSFAAAIQIRDRLADRRGAAFARSGMAWTMCRGNRLEEARSLVHQALRVHRELGDEKLECFTLNVLAEATLRAGDHDAALAILARTLPSLRLIGDRWAIAQAQCIAARAHLVGRRFDDACAAVEESLVLRREIGDRYGEAESLDVEAELLSALGRPEDGESSLRAAGELKAAIGDRLPPADSNAYTA
jgi:predicted ATPase/DNA-binding SARP family transcriptional activator